MHFDRSGTQPFIVAISSVVPAHLRAEFGMFAAGANARGHLVRAVVLVLAASFGAAVIFTPIAALLSWVRRRDLRALIPIGAVGIYLLLVFTLSQNFRFGNRDEMLHRPFLWTYFLLMVFGGAYFVRWVQSAPRLVPGRSGGIVQGASFALLVVPMLQGSDLVAHQAVRTPFGGSIINLRLPRGLYDCATYIRRQPGPRLLLDSQFDTDFVAVGGLAQRPSYLARPAVWKIVAPVLRNGEDFGHRLDAAKSVRTAATSVEFRAAAQATGVRWFLRHPEDPIAWAAAPFARACFASRGYEVYDLRELVRRCEDLESREAKPQAAGNYSVPSSLLPSLTSLSRSR